MVNFLRILSRIKHSPKMKGIRRYSNLLYYDPKTVVLTLSNFDYVEVDGCKFSSSDQLNSIQRVKGNPWFEGVRSTDVVLDIGANIGAVTIPLAKRAKSVISAEPIFADVLAQNVILNELSNVKIFPVGIGVPSAELTVFHFAGRTSQAFLWSFEELKFQCGGRIDFLKMDGEGCEWDILPTQLAGIRELRIEFHIRRGREKECRRKYQEYLKWMNENNYEVHVEHPHYGPDPYDAEDYMVRASLKENK